MKKIFLLVGFFIAFAQIAFARTIFTSYQNGTEKTSFFTNESVYLAPSTTNITWNSTTVRAYVVTDSNSWTNQSSLTDVTGNYKPLTTNSSGFLDSVTSLWAPTTIAGNYDVVIDVNDNGIYDSGIDYVFDSSVIGFQINPIPGPTLAFAVGGNNTADHTYTIPSNSTDNVMLQFKVTAGNAEAVYLNTVSLLASGTGNDVNGISYVKLVADSNGNGIIDQDESTPIVFDQYQHDNGVIQFNIPGSGFLIQPNTTVNFLVVYSMTKSSKNGDTYSFQVPGATGTGATSGMSAKISGLSINSAITTISLAGAVTTTTTTTSTSSSTSSSSSSTSTVTVKSNNQPNYFWIYVGAAVSASIVIVILVFYFRTAAAAKYEYKPPTQ